MAEKESRNPMGCQQKMAVAGQCLRSRKNWLLLVVGKVT